MTEYAHIAPAGAIRSAAVFGVPAVAICGHVWHPKPPRPDQPLCPECEAHAEAVLAPVEEGDAWRLASQPMPVERHEYRVTGMDGPRFNRTSSVIGVHPDDPDLGDQDAADVSLSLAESLREARGGTIVHRTLIETPWEPVDTREDD